MAYVIRPATNGFQWVDDGYVLQPGESFSETQPPILPPVNPPQGRENALIEKLVAKGALSRADADEIKGTK